MTILALLLVQELERNVVYGKTAGDDYPRCNRMPA